MIKIAPSLLSADFCEMGKAVCDVAAWGADYIHCDIMDGCYVANITFGQKMVSSIKKCASLPLDVHLMIERPEKFIDEFVDSGADLITFHPEASKHAHKTLGSIKARGVKGGIVINPGYAIESYEPMLEECDIVLLMSVNPGFGGQTFVRSTLEKLEKLRSYALHHALNYEIEVDGGINEETARWAIEAGATVLVAGNSIFAAENPAEVIARLRCGK